MLCDGGANGSIVDSKTCRIFWKDPIKKVDITGIDDHQVCNIQLYSAGFVTETQLGPTIIIVHNAAAVEQGNTILSGVQMQAHGCDVDDTPIKAEVPGKQCITTQTGYMIPLEICDGLPYLSGRPYTDQEWIKFCAAKTCMEQIVELRNYLRYLGVPIHEKTFVFGDNAAMIDSARLPFSKLHKRHHILTYHHVRNIIASGIISLSHLRSSHNPSNIMSKHYSYSSAKQLLGILFNTVGDPFRRIKWDLGK